MNKIYIYGLYDENNACRYVGWTIDIDRRIKKHLSPTRLRGNSHKQNWIKKMLSEGKKPTITIIEEVLDGDWQFAERYWIKKGRELGWDLTNNTRGGDGVVGRKRTEEEKQRISQTMKQHQRTEEHNANIAKSLQGKVLPDEVKAKISDALIGREVSSETKAKMSASRKGKPKSAEWAAKISAAQKGKSRAKWTPEMREHILQARAATRLKNKGNTCL